MVPDPNAHGAASLGLGMVALLALGIGAGLLWIRAKERLAREGIRGTARVLEMTESGTVNNRPLMKLKLLVEAPGIEPYEVTKRVSVGHGLRPGRLHLSALARRYRNTGGAPESVRTFALCLQD